jgi:prepilin-type N-terminal cleavage/methylation domain-containing protein
MDASFFLRSLASRSVENSGRGFTLLEVVVAMGLLAIAALPIAAALGAAVQYSGAAAAARRALTDAEAVANSVTRSVVYPSGWRDVGDAGSDHLPGTADDGSGVGQNAGPSCRRRITPRLSGGVEWLWVEVDCGSSVSGAAAGSDESRAGGKLGKKVRLVTAR